jgi:hypothetical protein
VRLYRERRNFDWNTYAIVGVIELARDNGKNPKVPKWLEKDYSQSIRDLAEIGATEVLRTKKQKRFGQYLAFLRFSQALEPHAKFLIDYSADELLEMEKLASEIAPSSPAEHKARP